MARPKKEAFNRSDKRYEAKVTVGKDINGKCIQKSFYSTKSKDDAKKKGLEYLNALEHGRLEETIKNQNFAVWADKWLESYKKNEVKPNSYAFTYKNSVDNHLKPYFGKMDLTDIKASNVRDFFNQKAKTHSPATCKKIRMCLNSIFETAIDDDLCFKNPCRNIKIKDEDARNKKSVYRKEEIDKIVDFAKGHRFGLDIILLALTGIRRGELLALRWEDIDLDHDIIHIRQAVAEMKNPQTGKINAVLGLPKTPTSIRDIPISSVLHGVLTNAPREIEYGGNKRKKIAPIHIKPEFVIHTEQGGMCSPRTWSRRHYDVFMQEMAAHYQEKGIEIPILNPHEIRHTFATIKYTDGMNLLSLAKVLGHSDLEMLASRYGHTDIEALRKDLETTNKEDV